MSTGQVPNFCSERESPEDMRAFSKERTESCGDSAPERTWRSHGPPQSRAGKTAPMRLAIAEILPVSVDFVRQDPAGVMPLSRSEPLCHFPQISRLIVGVKRTALQPRPSVNDTDVQLRAKLHRLSRFSPSRCVYGILCISGNLSGRVCGRFEASFRPRDREEHPKAFRRSPWPR